MKRVWVGRLCAAGLLIVMLAVIASSASAVVVHQRNGHFLGVTPRRGVSPASIPGSVAAANGASGFSSTGNLAYTGGPVIHSSAPYLIFWTPSGESIAASSQALLERHFTDVAADSGRATNVYGVDRQFTDGSGFADYRQTFSSASQAIVDAQAYPVRDLLNCPDVNATYYPTCLTDAQLQAEVSRLIAADGLPTGTGANAPIYFVVTPGDVNICADASNCADTVFCAYHSSFTDGAATVLYSAIPLFFDGASAGQNPKYCQSDGNPIVQEPNADIADVAIKYMSHEDNEALTDPVGTGWWNSSGGNENGDNCNSYATNPNSFTPTLGGTSSAGTLFNQLINGDPYYVQSEWSNGDVNCEMSPSPGNVAPSFSVPPPGSNPVGAALTLDPSTSTSTNPYTSETWDFGDGTPTVFNVGPTLVTGSHTYATAGSYSAKLTLVDDRGNLASTTQQITVGSPPQAAFTTSAAQPLERTPVSFDGGRSSDPDAGVTITSYAWSFGDGSTGTGAASNHAYANTGTYTVTLTAANSLGLTSTSVQQLTVADETPSAAVAITTTQPASGQPVTFSGARSTDPDGSIGSYAWSFGDGSTGTSANPSHTYSRPGTYVAELTVTDSSGRTATATHPVVVALSGRIIKLVVHRHRAGATLLVRVNAPGSLSAGRKMKPMSRAGTAKFAIQLNRAQLTNLARTHKLKLRVQVKFRPTAGRPSSRTVTINFRR